MHGKGDMLVFGATMALPAFRAPRPSIGVHVAAFVPYLFLQPAHTRAGAVRRRLHPFVANPSATRVEWGTPQGDREARPLRVCEI